MPATCNMPATCKKCSLLRALRDAVDYFGRLIELALAPYLGGLWLVTARPPRKGTESVTELLCWVEVLGHSTTATRTSGDVSPACTRKIIGANTGFLTARQTRSPLISPHHYYTKRRPKVQSAWVVVEQVPSQQGGASKRLTSQIVPNAGISVNGPLL